MVDEHIPIHEPEHAAAEAPVPTPEVVHEGPSDFSPPEPIAQVAAPPPAPSPAQIIAAANAIYTAHLTAAAEPDPEVKKLRDMARQLWQQADAIDGPERIMARQMLQQHNQSLQRQRQQQRIVPPTPAPKAPPA